MFEISVLEFSRNIAGHLTTSLLIVLAALLVKLFFNRMVRIAIKRVEDGDPRTISALEQRAYLLGSMVKSLMSTLILGIAGMMILSEWGVDIAPILTGAGILGLAVGFGAQTLVKDVVTGFFILLENQFNAGDEIEIGGVRGRVIRMNLRTTTLKGESGEIHIIPNSQIAKITKFSKKKS